MHIYNDLRIAFDDMLSKYSNDPLASILTKSSKDVLMTTKYQDGFLGAFFDELGRIQENIVDKGNMFDLEGALSDNVYLENIKIKLGIEGLRCFCDDVYTTGPILFLTAKECIIVDRHPMQFNEILHGEILESALEGNRTLKLMCAGGTYSTFDELKADWLTYKLSGLNGE